MPVLPPDTDAQGIFLEHFLDHSGPARLLNLFGLDDDPVSDLSRAPRRPPADATPSGTIRSTGIRRCFPSTFACATHIPGSTLPPSCAERWTRTHHCGFKLGVVAEKAGVKREVAVCGVGRHAQGSSAGSKVDRLRAGHDYRTAVR